MGRDLKVTQSTVGERPVGVEAGGGDKQNKGESPLEIN